MEAKGDDGYCMLNGQIVMALKVLNDSGAGMKSIIIQDRIQDQWK